MRYGKGNHHTNFGSRHLTQSTVKWLEWCVGLTDNDRYTLELDILVAEKMGITKGHIPDSWFSIYHGVMLNIKHTTNPKQEAERMYALLLKHSQG